MAERDDFKRGYWSRVEIPTGCKSFFSLIFVYKVTSMNSYIRLINLKRRVFDLAGTKNSSWTDRPRKSGRFEIKRF
jgi:hypothetical protein